jgi:hypothetical protein
LIQSTLLHRKLLRFESLPNLLQSSSLGRLIRLETKRAKMGDKDEPETKRAKMADKVDEHPKQRKSSRLVHLFVVFVGGLIYYFIKRSIDVQSEKSEVVLKSPRTSYPPSTVNRGVCLFISDAASGVGRELALRIAATGVHVLAGKFLHRPLHS